MNDWRNDIACLVLLLNGSSPWQRDWNTALNGLCMDSRDSWIWNRHLRWHLIHKVVLSLFFSKLRFSSEIVYCFLDVDCSVLFFSRPRSEGWPHHGRTFSIYPCPLSFWLTLPRRVLFTSSCCPSRPCVAFLGFVHLALFLALSLSPGNSLVSSLCDHSILASLLWRCLTVPSLLQLC